MEHKSILELLDELKVERLIDDNFDAFVEKAKSLFEPQGTGFDLYRRAGYNQFTKQHFHEKGQPDWFLQPLELTYERLTVKKFTTMTGAIIHFDDLKETCLVESGKRPLKFAFDTGRCLYLRDECHEGTFEFPYEMLFLRKS